RAGRTHRRNFIHTLHDVTEQELLVRETGPTELFPDLLQRNVPALPSTQLLELFGPLRGQQPVLQVLIHPSVARIVPVDALSKQDQLVNDMLVSFSGGYVDRG